MKKKMGALAILAAFSLAIPLVTHVWAKAHVPADEAQMCHKGHVIQVELDAVDAHRRHGDCRINAALLVPPLFPGNKCDPDALGVLCF